MTKNLNRCRMFLKACLLLLLVGMVPILLTWRAWKQARLDNALIAHIIANNFEAASADLQQGADANCRDVFEGMPKPSLKAWLQHYRKRQFNAEAYFTPLLLAVRPYYNETFYDPSRLRATPPPEKTLSLVRSLVEHGADVNAKFDAGMGAGYSTTTLCDATEYAVETGSLDIPTFLLEHHADVNTGRHTSINPLLIACTAQYPALVRLLLKYHADVQVKDEEGHSPYWHTKHPKYGPGVSTEILSLLRQSGAKE